MNGCSTYSTYLDTPVKLGLMTVSQTLRCMIHLTNIHLFTKVRTCESYIFHTPTVAFQEERKKRENMIPYYGLYSFCTLANAHLCFCCEWHTFTMRVKLFSVYFHVIHFFFFLQEPLYHKILHKFRNNVFTFWFSAYFMAVKIIGSQS